jgi:hypothetical protein
MLCGCGSGAKQTSKDKQGLGALCCAVRVLGLSQSKGFVLGLVLCAGAKQTKQGFGLSYNQRLGVWCFGGCGAGISYIQALAWCLVWC